MLNYGIIRLMIFLCFNFPLRTYSGVRVYFGILSRLDLRDAIKLPIRFLSGHRYRTRRFNIINEGVLFNTGCLSGYG